MTTIEIKIRRNDSHATPGKLAEAEIPARQFTTNGQRRSFLLLRAISEPVAQDRLREFVLRAYRAHEQQLEKAASA
jgi:hypothetical protein